MEAAELTQEINRMEDLLARCEYRDVIGICADVEDKIHAGWRARPVLALYLPCITYYAGYSFMRLGETVRALELLKDAKAKMAIIMADEKVKFLHKNYAVIDKKNDEAISICERAQ